MRIFNDRNGQRLPVRSWCNEPEPGAIQQAIDVSNHPAAVSHVALMPDTHQGYGMPIGGVAALKNHISPYMVGVDIACGMIARRFDLDATRLPKEDLASIMKDVRRLIPMGSAHQSELKLFRKDADLLFERHERTLNSVVLNDRSRGLLKIDYIAEQLGTLGGGNHFIEIQDDEAGRMWIMIHSGSRNLGKCVCEIYNRIALDMNLKGNFKIPNRNLASLPVDTENGQAYIALMNFCMDFSFLNRECMFRQVVKALRKTLGNEPEMEESINIHHNYAALEEHYGEKVWLHRKGATLAAAGTLGIIPGSMGTASYIVRGKGSKESFASCSHGAGRVSSRTDAKRKFSMENFRQAMDGIVFDCRPGLLDESPMAYKDISVVMEEQKDLVDIVHSLRPLAVEKG